MLRNEYNPMNAAELMDGVFDVYKRSFVKQLAFSALVGVISFILMVVLGFIAAMAVILPMIDAPDDAFVGMIVSILAAMLPVYWIWTATADAGHILLSKQAFYRQPVRVPVKKLPGIVLRVLTASLAQMLLSIPWLVLIGLSVYALSRSSGYNMSDMSSVMIFLSSYGWVVITIIAAFVYVVYSNVFALAVPVAVFEHRFFWGTITRSWQLVKGEFWKILGVRILWSVVVYLFSYSAQGVWAVIQAVLVAGAAESPMLVTTIGTLLQSFVTLLIGFIMGPLGGILTALIYFNQRIKKEGLDIEIGLEQLNA